MSMYGRHDWPVALNGSFQVCPRRGLATEVKAQGGPSDISVEQTSSLGSLLALEGDDGRDFGSRSGVWSSKIRPVSQCL